MRMNINHNRNGSNFQMNYNNTPQIFNRFPRGCKTTIPSSQGSTNKSQSKGKINKYSSTDQQSNINPNNTKYNTSDSKRNPSSENSNRSNNTTSYNSNMNTNKYVIKNQVITNKNERNKSGRITQSRDNKSKEKGDKYDRFGTMNEALNKIRMDFEKGKTPIKIGNNQIENNIFVNPYQSNNKNIPSFNSPTNIKNINVNSPQMNNFFRSGERIPLTQKSQEMSRITVKRAIKNTSIEPKLSTGFIRVRDYANKSSAICPNERNYQSNLENYNYNNEYIKSPMSKEVSDFNTNDDYKNAYDILHISRSPRNINKAKEEMQKEVEKLKEEVNKLQMKNKELSQKIKDQKKNIFISTNEEFTIPSSYIPLTLKKEENWIENYNTFINKETKSEESEKDKVNNMCNQLNKENFYLENKIDLLEYQMKEELRRRQEEKRRKKDNHKSDKDEELFMLYNFYATISRIFGTSPIPQHSLSKLENNLPKALLNLLNQIKDLKGDNKSEA